MKEAIDNIEEWIRMNNKGKSSEVSGKSYEYGYGQLYREGKNGGVKERERQGEGSYTYRY